MSIPKPLNAVEVLQFCEAKQIEISIDTGVSDGMVHLFLSNYPEITVCSTDLLTAIVEIGKKLPEAK